MSKLSDKERYKTGTHKLSKIKVSNIIYPIVIGLVVVGYMVYDEFDVNAFSQISFDLKTLFWLFISVLFMCGRDLGYIIRLRIFSEGKMSWYECFRVIMLWEFTSAVTPSAIGGTSVAVIYVHQAGISIGKSTSIVLLTSFFDELYFILMFPILLLIVGYSELFDIANNVSTGIATSFIMIVLIGYFAKLAFLLLVSYGLFFNPKGIKWLILKIFSIKFLRKWRVIAAQTGDDIIISSKELKTKSLVFWIKSFAATFLSWSSRYFVVNTLLLAFFTVDDHFLLFGRQLIMWIMMLVMPTPGGSGFSEFLFTEYLGEFVPIASIAVLMALLWRLVTYYPYLLIGAVVFPRWIKDKFGKQKK